MPDLKVPGLAVRGMGGRVEADGVVDSLVNADGAYIAYDTTYGVLGVKGNGAGTSRGLKARTLNAGAALDALTLEATGEAKLVRQTSVTVPDTTLPLILEITGAAASYNGMLRFRRSAATKAALGLDASDVLSVLNAAGSGLGNLNVAALLAQAGITVSAGGLAVNAGASAFQAATATSIALGTTPASTGVVRIPNASPIYARNGINSADFPVISLDANNQVTIGTGTIATGPTIRITYDAAVDLLAGAASRNGLLGIDATNNRLVFYSGGNRYYVTGTSF